MDKKNLIDNACYALECYARELEYPDAYSYQSNDDYRAAVARANEIRQYINELKKL